MKSIKFSAISVMTLVVFTLFLIACPELEEDGEILDLTEDAELIKKEGSLDDILWMEILAEIEKGGKYVKLDLSECSLPSAGKVLFEDTVNGEPGHVVFNPLPEVSTGKKYIVSIIIPEAASVIVSAVPIDSFVYTMRIEQEIIEASAFRHFENLRSVAGRRIEIAGNFAFVNSKFLNKLDFPNIHRVLQGAFYGCTALEEVYFNVALSVSIRAFENCTKLKTVYMPTIGVDAGLMDAGAFKNCTSLTNVNFPYVKQIDKEAFSGCTNLVEAVFPSVTIIGEEAFRDCTKLDRAAFHANPARQDPASFPVHPLDATLGGTREGSVIFYFNAFRGCKELKELDVRYAWNVYFFAGVLADIGEHIDIFLFDDDGTGGSGKSYGHEQSEMYLGGEGKGPLSLKSIRLSLPWVNPDDSMVLGTGGIADDLDSRYSTLEVVVQKRAPLAP